MHGTTFPDDPGSQGGYVSSYTAEKKPWSGGGGNGGGGGGFKKFGPPKPEEIDPTLYLSAAVTGNKDTPQPVLDKIKELVKYLESNGFMIRTGSDGPVEEAAEIATKKEMILPWKEFNGRNSPLTWPVERAHHIAKMFHPTYDQMKKGVHGILAKNARLVMGHKMTSPATLLLVWTEDGAEAYRDVGSRSGFAGHPIKIASAAGIRVFNIGKPDAEQRLRAFVEALTANKG